MEEKLQLRHIAVGMLQTNCYWLWLEGRDDCIVVDPGADADRIRKAINGKKIAAILLTHGHFDHIAAVDALMTPQTQLIIHEHDAPMLQSTELNASWMVGAPIVCRKATRTVQEGEIIEVAGITLTVLHTPGHTAGSVCYQVGHYLLTGDTMFDFGYGRTDLPTGSDGDMRASLRRLMPLRQEYTICGGHS